MDASVVPARARARGRLTLTELELVAAVVRCVPHGRARTASEIVEVLRRARVVVDVETVEAALVTATGVEQVEPGRWRRG